MLAALSLLARRCHVAGLLILLATGCSTVHVESGPGPSITAALRLSLPGETGLSARTMQELYRRDLAALYPTSLDELAARLHADALAEPSAALLFALAEVNHARGRKAEKSHDPHAALCYLRAAGYAYHFLFGPDAQVCKPAAAFDPRFRVACDLYNTALARFLVLRQDHSQVDPHSQWWQPGHNDAEDSARLEIVHVGFSEQSDQLGSVLLCSGYRVVGLATRHRTFGLGVPLIGKHSPVAETRPFVAADLHFPITAFCRFEGGLADLVEAPRARLELINPLVISSVKVHAQEVPLETDLTTPLAHYLGDAHLEKVGYRSFLSPDALGPQGGLHFLEPYQPGKVPVVLVHGLVSSPATWAALLNDLLADPLIRQRFQFAVFFYPTGAPFLATAADLRGDLDRFRRTVDPDHTDSTLDETVVIGHSMGGLLGRLLTVEGGEDFQRLIAAEPLDRLKTTAPAVDELRRTCLFHRESCVKRVIFMGTPHRGSKISPSLLGRLAAHLAGMPRALLDTTQELARLNPQLPEGACKFPTSVELLDPSAPVLTLLVHRPRPADVHYHSVIGVAMSNALFVEHFFGGDGKAGDGVVDYDSAHIEGVDSELVVQANHYRVHQHPLAIHEVRRILLGHLEEIEHRRPAMTTCLSR
jgi:pimeloyl-ACP methyl ester carboxylesterase